MGLTITSAFLMSTLQARSNSFYSSDVYLKSTAAQKINYLWEEIWKDLKGGDYPFVIWTLGLFF